MWAETSEQILAQGVQLSANKHIPIVDFMAVIIKKICAVKFSPYYQPSSL